MSVTACFGIWSVCWTPLSLYQEYFHLLLQSNFYVSQGHLLFGAFTLSGLHDASKRSGLSAHREFSRGHVKDTWLYFALKPSVPEVLSACQVFAAG